jgi:hypothetical protein
VAQREILELELGTGSKRGSERNQQGRDYGHGHWRAYPGRSSKIDCVNENAFLVGTGGTNGMYERTDQNVCSPGWRQV